MRADGSEKRQLTRPPGISIDPVWSPDARRIAFLSTRDSTPNEARRFQLYTMEADGTGFRRLTNPRDGFAEGGISWSPDGQRMVFGCRPTGANTERLCIITTSGSGLKDLLPPLWRGLQAAWSPDGATIAFVGSGPAPTSSLQVFAVGPDGGTPRLLTNELGLQMEPTWSADGTLLIVSVRGGPLAVGSELVTMRPDGSGRVRLYPDAYLRSYFATPVWSPDGNRIAFRRSDFDTGSGYRYYIANRDGTDVQPFPILEVTSTRVSWAPD